MPEVTKYSIQSSTLQDIADAIREKKESEDPIAVSDFADEILTIRGGGKLYPQATKTLLVDNASLADTLNFADSYTNYDFLEIVTYNTSSQKETSFLVTPSMVTACFTYSRNLMNFNEFYTNQYVCYAKTSDTVWTRNSARNLRIKTINGLTLTNATKTETELYSREGISSSATTFTPPEGKTFYDYDYILFVTCTGSSDETQPCTSIFINSISEEDDFLNAYGSKNILIDRYNNYTVVTIGETTITSSYYFYVIGLNFEYT